tara:strand:- start:19778 stop:21292 length:1515 start_codon:yes stop_codon:yes gene_type:complete
MAENTPDNPASDFTPQQAAAPVFGMGDTQAQQAKQQQQTKILWGIFSMLLILVLGVIFILPRYIATPDPGTVAPVILPVERATPREAFSPFQEAQMLREREAAQNILAEILDLQEQLEAIGAESWAADAYAAALQVAGEGDAAYRNQEFENAQLLYQNGLLALQEIESNSLTLFAESLVAGEAAIDAGRPAAAVEAFETALLINEESTEAQSGLERARLLPEVLALMEQAEDQHDRGQLESALDLYTQATVVDPAHSAAAAAVTQTRIDILDRDFLNFMSSGFSAVQAGNPEVALESFNRALQLKPQSAEALAAITQAQDMQTSRDLNIQLDAAREHEAAERWAQALQAYNNALAIDANLVSAIEGRERTQNRSTLDNYLNNINNNPYRLSDEQVYQQTITVYNDALTLVEENTRLYNQLVTLRSFLDKARVPVAVTLTSDGLTNVTVYRVNELGMFNSQTLSLIPGTYTAVGIRPGYRDVREEFTVPFDGEAPHVTVICNEPV